MTLDKDIHRNEFRLRVLTTNTCNQECSYCLNDFQNKIPEYFIDVDFAKRIIEEYCFFMKFNVQSTPLINISGGEPGIHPGIHDIVRAPSSASKVMLNTNGTALKLTDLDPYVDHWRVHVFNTDPTLLNHINRTQAQIVFVVTEDTSMNQLDEIIRFYSYHNIEIKLFVDFNCSEYFLHVFPAMVQAMKLKYPKAIIKTRFTGLQKNRGKACKGCNERCITLKALWVFPEGYVSTCPQGKKEKIFPDGNIKEIIQWAYNEHKY